MLEDAASDRLRVMNGDGGQYDKEAHMMQDAHKMKQDESAAASEIPSEIENANFKNTETGYNKPSAVQPRVLNQQGMTDVISKEKAVEALKRQQLDLFEKQAEKGLHVSGCPDVNYNGFYVRDDEYPTGNGQIHLKNPGGKHIYYGPQGKWYMNNEFTPAKDVCKAFYATEQAAMSASLDLTSAKAVFSKVEEWRYWDGNAWVTYMLEFEYGEAARERLDKDKARRKQNEERWRSQAQMGYYITLAPDITYNGLYRLDAAEPMANGRPHCVNTEDKHMYYGPTGKWYLNNEYSPDKDTCKAFLATSAGVAGVQSWKYWDGVHEEWMGHDLNILHSEAAVAQQKQDDTKEASMQADLMAIANEAGYYVSGCIATAFNGLYLVDQAVPICNKRPHLTKVEEDGGRVSQYHLYCGAGGKWYLNNQYTPNEDTCKAYSANQHSNIQGKQDWIYWDGVHGEWTPRPITVVYGPEAAELAQRDKDKMKDMVAGGLGVEDKRRTKFMALVAATSTTAAEQEEEEAADEQKDQMLWQFLVDSAECAANTHSEASSHPADRLPVEYEEGTPHATPPVAAKKKKSSGGCCTSTPKATSKFERLE